MATLVQLPVMWPDQSIGSEMLKASNVITQAQMVQRESRIHRILLTSLRIHDAVHQLLGATPASDDDLALVGGTFGSGVPTVQTGDVSAAVKTRRARFEVALPGDYVAGQDLALVATCGMLVAAGNSATIDFEAFKCGDGGAVDGSDRVATSAQSMNSTTFSEKTFVIDGTTLAPGDRLDVRMTVSTDDGAGTGVIGVVSGLKLLADCKP